MKNKKKYTIISIIMIAILTFITPVKTGQGKWVNDDPIADVGHYLTSYYNIYNIKIWEK